MAAALAALSCGAPTGDPVGFEGPERPVKKVVLYPADVGWRDTCYDVFVPTGRHYRLAVGSYGASGNRFRSRALIRYDVSEIPKEIRISTITSVLLRLPYLRVSGSFNDDIYAQRDVTIEARALRRFFDEDVATWWRASLKEDWGTEGGDFGPTEANAVIGKPSYQREDINLDITKLALEWLGNPYRNYGVLLKAADEDAAPGIKEFYSSNDFKSKAFAPRLDITYIDDEGEKAYRVVLPEKDCFITDYDGRFGGGDVHGYDEFLDVGSFNGYGRRMLVYFNLSPGATGIPSSASIACARLRLYYVPASRDERVYVVVYRLLAAFDENMKQDVLELQKYHDNVVYVDVDFKMVAPGYVDIYVNKLVQEWVSGTHRNYGLMMKAANENLAQTFPRFGAKDNAKSGRRPYLEIEYTLPGEPPFTPTGPS
ncbi:MAG: DNRLRE domain-containing protein [candidate division Zixibacteria bacterium]|nr:DNRLRE domain-containing protein [candidate division Zixibacteria bacterium]